MQRLRTAVLLSALAASAHLYAGPLSAQARADSEDRPRVEAVVIRGVTGVNMGELRRGLMTQPSRCRSIFFQPFCWFTDAGFFVRKRTLDRAELPRDELRLRVYLWRRGWRRSTVATRVEPQGDGVRVTFDVAQGPPTLVSAVELTQNGRVLGKRPLRSARLPESGKPLNVLQLDSARARLLNAFWSRGYGDAQVRDTTVLTDSLNAVVRVTLDPGRRTTIEQIEVEGNERVSDRTVVEALPIRPNRLFRRAQVAEAQRALYLTGMFQEALIRVPELQDSAKTVRVSVREAPFRLVRARVGFSTVDFLQTQGQFTHYDWLGGGRRLDLTGVLGRLFASQLEGQIGPGAEPLAPSGVPEEAFLRPTWQASAQVTQPAFPAAGNSFALGIFTHRRVQPAVVVDRGYGANLAFTHTLASRAPLSLVYRFEKNTVLAGDVYFCVNYGVCDSPTIEALQARRSLSPLSLAGFIDRVDDQLLRGSGYTARLALAHGSAVTASDFRYNRAEAEFTRDIPMGRGTVAARVHGGWVQGGRAPDGSGSGGGSEGEVLHPSTRFYAGGARSVRGFGENQLGPRILTVDPTRLLGPPDDSDAAPCTLAELVQGTCDPNGVSSEHFTPRPVGGTRVLGLNLEYRRPVRGNLVGAVFVDAARVGDPALQEVAEPRTAVTPGFGVRYRSPIGPVRLDLGIRTAAAEDLVVITQVTEGGINRLVRLDTRKRYDPLEANTGFLGQLTSRLTLHLSIGEAF